MEKGFVKIQTVYGKPQNRTVEELRKFYDNNNLLQKAICNLTNKSLNPSTLEGKKVFLKPNWVNHKRSAEDDICLVTHEKFILNFLEVILKNKPASILIGDAPIQGCNWDKLLSEDFYEQVKALSEKHAIEVRVKDLRRVSMIFTDGVKRSEKKPLDDYLIFDVGQKSFLEPISVKNKNPFRVTHYDPDRFLESHTQGMHKYCITKEFFEADVVISLPKSKTHSKTGITNALKNIVGLNGDKDFLPHHRIGGTSVGGDSYPGKNFLRHWSELCFDQANRKLGTPSYRMWVRLASLFWIISMPGPMDKVGAGWHGNDTAWRMVMDLNQIAIYGTKEGVLSSTPQRVMYSLCDAIIGGQGEGPLFPKPLPLGMICFTNDSAWADFYMAHIMGMDTSKLPLLNAAIAFSKNPNPLLEIDGKVSTLTDAKKHSLEAMMPSGWVNYKK